MENIFFWQNNDIICLYFFSNCDILFSWLNFCEKSNLRWRIVDNLAPCSCAGAVEYSRTLLHHARRKTRPCRTLHPPIANKPHYRGGGKLALGGCSRFFGDLALRHSVGLRLTHALSVVVLINFKYTLSRRSLGEDGSCTMLVAKHDLVARCTHRLQTNRISLLS